MVNSKLITLNQFYSANKRVITVFITTFLVLICNKYLSETEFVRTIFVNLGFNALASSMSEAFTFSNNADFNSLVFWILVLNFFYLIIPVFVIRFILKERATDFGLNFKIEKGFLKYFLPFMAFMVVMVFLVSFTQSFQNKYPFYKISSSEQLFPRFLLWELLYCSQFFCLEFFFRGFMVKGLQEKFGVFSILIMTVPYCMIHFGKPMLETIGSVFAGLILGYISYKGKSVVPGFLMHITVAISMDFFALWQKGILFK